MKVPRDVDASGLIKCLESLGYTITRQKGSHIRMTKLLDSSEHHITIPNHSPVKIGTLNSILNDVAEKLKIPKEKIISKL